jgi:deazaflavin-dependent oxidoreductase (nitroreductase family)
MADDRSGGTGAGDALAAGEVADAGGAPGAGAADADGATGSNAAPAAPAKAPWLPPRWFVRLAWYVHRAYYRVTGGRRGLWLPRTGKWGTMRLHSEGRRSGKERVAILGYYEDGPNLVTLAMNGWAEGEPAWWLNLLAHPDARVDLKDGSVAVRARAAEGEERARLWSRWHDFGDDVDGFSTLRPSETAVVVLEPRPGP